MEWDAATVQVVTAMSGIAEDECYLVPLDATQVDSQGGGFPLTYWPSPSPVASALGRRWNMAATRPEHVPDAVQNNEPEATSVSPARTATFLPSAWIHTRISHAHTAVRYIFGKSYFTHAALVSSHELGRRRVVRTETGTMVGDGADVADRALGTTLSGSQSATLGVPGRDWHPEAVDIHGTARFCQHTNVVRLAPWRPDEQTCEAATAAVGAQQEVVASTTTVDVLEAVRSHLPESRRSEGPPPTVELVAALRAGSKVRTVRIDLNDPAAPFKVSVVPPSAPPVSPLNQHGPVHGAVSFDTPAPPLSNDEWTAAVSKAICASWVRDVVRGNCRTSCEVADLSALQAEQPGDSLTQLQQEFVGSVMGPLIASAAQDRTAEEPLGAAARSVVGRWPPVMTAVEGYARGAPEPCVAWIEVRATDSLRVRPADVVNLGLGEPDEAPDVGQDRGWNDDEGSEAPEEDSALVLRRTTAWRVPAASPPAVAANDAHAVARNKGHWREWKSATEETESGDGESANDQAAHAREERTDTGQFELLDRDQLVRAQTAFVDFSLTSPGLEMAQSRLLANQGASPRAQTIVHAELSAQIERFAAVGDAVGRIASQATPTVALHDLPRLPCVGRRNVSRLLRHMPATVADLDMLVSVGDADTIDTTIPRTFRLEKTLGFRRDVWDSPGMTVAEVCRLELLRKVQAGWPLTLLLNEHVATAAVGGTPNELTDGSGLLRSDVARDHTTWNPLRAPQPTEQHSLAGSARRARIACEHVLSELKRTVAAVVRQCAQGISDASHAAGAGCPVQLEATFGLAMAVHFESHFAALDVALLRTLFHGGHDRQHELTATLTKTVRLVHVIPAHVHDLCANVAADGKAAVKELSWASTWVSVHPKPAVENGALTSPSPPGFTAAEHYEHELLSVHARHGDYLVMRHPRRQLFVDALLRRPDRDLDCRLTLSVAEPVATPLFGPPEQHVLYSVQRGTISVADANSGLAAIHSAFRVASVEETTTEAPHPAVSALVRARDLAVDAPPVWQGSAVERVTVKVVDSIAGFSSVDERNIDGWAAETPSQHSVVVKRDLNHDFPIPPPCSSSSLTWYRAVSTAFGDGVLRAGGDGSVERMAIGMSPGTMPALLLDTLRCVEAFNPTFRVRHAPYIADIARFPSTIRDIVLGSTDQVIRPLDADAASQWRCQSQNLSWGELVDVCNETTIPDTWSATAGDRKAMSTTNGIFNINQVARVVMLGAVNLGGWSTKDEVLKDGTATGTGAMSTELVAYRGLEGARGTSDLVRKLGARVGGFCALAIRLGLATLKDLPLLSHERGVLHRLALPGGTLSNTERHFGPLPWTPHDDDASASSFVAKRLEAHSDRVLEPSFEVSASTSENDLHLRLIVNGRAQAPVHRDTGRCPVSFDELRTALRNETGEWETPEGPVRTWQLEENVRVSQGKWSVVHTGGALPCDLAVGATPLSNTRSVSIVAQPASMGACTLASPSNAFRASSRVASSRSDKVVNAALHCACVFVLGGAADVANPAAVHSSGVWDDWERPISIDEAGEHVTGSVARPKTPDATAAQVFDTIKAIGHKSYRVQLGLKSYRTVVAGGADASDVAATAVAAPWRPVARAAGEALPRAPATITAWERIDGGAVLLHPSGDQSTELQLQFIARRRGNAATAAASIENSASKALQASSFGAHPLSHSLEVGVALTIDMPTQHDTAYHNVVSACDMVDALASPRRRLEEADAHSANARWGVQREDGVSQLIGSERMRARRSGVFSLNAAGVLGIEDLSLAPTCQANPITDTTENDSKQPEFRQLLASTGEFTPQAAATFDPVGEEASSGISSRLLHIPRNLPFLFTIRPTRGPVASWLPRSSEVASNFTIPEATRAARECSASELAPHFAATLAKLPPIGTESYEPWLTAATTAEAVARVDVGIATPANVDTMHRWMSHGRKQGVEPSAFVAPSMVWVDMASGSMLVALYSGAGRRDPLCVASSFVPCGVTLTSPLGNPVGWIAMNAVEATGAVDVPVAVGDAAPTASALDARWCWASKKPEAWQEQEPLLYRNRFVGFSPAVSPSTAPRPFIPSALLLRGMFKRIL